MRPRERLEPPSIVGLALKGTREFSQADQTGNTLDLTLGVVAD